MHLNVKFDQGLPKNARCDPPSRIPNAATDIDDLLARASDMGTCMAGWRPGRGLQVLVFSRAISWVDHLRKRGECVSVCVVCGSVVTCVPNGHGFDQCFFEKK